MSNETESGYNFKTIESKWQSQWEEQKTFQTPDESSKPKYYILDMFPYPSGNGLHVGHGEGYTATDIMARYKRMKGFNVLHPMGWDAFGLPAEQYAIKTGTHPVVTTKENVANFKKQIKSLGFSTDWDREINTTDPKYYRWTQWIFLQLYKKGLAYESFAPVNWCPALGTVLANEEVVDGKSEVGGFPVEKKPIRQWVLKITEYAEKLLQDLDDLDWPESTKEMQRNWIGKSIGAVVHFSLESDSSESFEIFTTRPDTLYGATFCVLAPEHPLIEKLVSDDRKDEVQAYINEALNKNDMDRSALNKDKTGVFTGGYAVNPVNGERVPVYVADYVLMNYGSGAIMAVPAHDERDHEFARKYKIPIRQVLTCPEGHDIQEQAFTGDSAVINSDFLNGLTRTDAIERVCVWLEEKGLGKKSVSYRLRDWIFSRQRYWGEPFPIAHNHKGEIIAVSEQDLPITLPEIDDYKPTSDGEPPLARAKDWLNFENDGETWTRETNIMPQWAGSCWYYLRYIDPHNEMEPWNKDKESYWLPVDLYVGGVEHANLHLLYARFWHKVLYDLGYVSSKEPFKKLRHPGLVLGSNGEKMSKSRGNVVNPDDVIAEWGADSLRLYEMFMGPLEQVKPWQTQGIVGVHRFLKRFYSFMVAEGSFQLSERVTDGESSPEFTNLLHKTIKRVTEDCEDLKFNTAISAMMELLNLAYKQQTIHHDHAKQMVLILAPFAPHLCEELWQFMGGKELLAYEAWPSFDPSLVADEQITLSVMINGKMRGTVSVAKDSAKEDVITQVKEQDFVQRYISGKEIKREIFVPGKIVNFIV